MGLGGTAPRQSKTEDEDELEDDYDFGTRAIEDGTIYEVGAEATLKNYRQRIFSMLLSCNGNPIRSRKAGCLLS